MNKKQFEDTTEITHWTKECLMDDMLGMRKEEKEVIESLWAQAESVEEFVLRCMQEYFINTSQGVLRLVGETYHRRKAYLTMMLNRLDPYHVSSDRGGILLGNEHVNMLVSNGYGDGTTAVYVIPTSMNQNFLSEEVVDYFTVIDGTFNLYDNDCYARETDILTTLTGMFNVYAKDGTVYIAETSKE